MNGHDYVASSNKLMRKNRVWLVCWQPARSVNTYGTDYGKSGKIDNGLERKDKKDLLRQMIDRVIVDYDGNVKLSLRTPFAYLRELSNEIRNITSTKQGNGKQKSARPMSDASSGECSRQLHLCWTDRNLSEQSPSLNRSTFIQRIQFPYHAHLVRLSTLD